MEENVSYLAFNCSGDLLLTAGDSGTEFHIFSILPHPLNPAMGAVHHLYTLYRGATPALIIGVKFSSDSRWVAVSSNHGTTHVYPVTPYGGPVTVRTHLTTKMVNRQSAFYRSAGLEKLEAICGGTPPSPPRYLSASPASPVSSSKGSPVSKELHPSITALNTANSKASVNPRLPPMPVPICLQALAKIRQSLLPSLPEISPTSAGAGNCAVSAANPPPTSGCPIAATFAGSARGFPILNPDPARKSANESAEALYVMNGSWELVEYLLKPGGAINGHSKNPPPDAPLQLDLLPAAQWTLKRFCFSLKRFFFRF